MIDIKTRFDNRNAFCKECKTEMFYNGAGFECPICGFSYEV